MQNEIKVNDEFILHKLEKIFSLSIKKRNKKDLKI